MPLAFLWCEWGVDFKSQFLYLHRREEEEKGKLNQYRQCFMIHYSSVRGQLNLVMDSYSDNKKLEKLKEK